MIMIGASAGLTFRYVGLLGSPDGRRFRAALIAACTSRAAPSMSRFKSNCNVIRVEPSDDDEVISVTPAMRPSERSSGVATVAAIVSGLAPGRLACTEIVGKSTCGKGDTGRSRNAAAPASASPMVSKVVATGRSIKGADRFTCQSRGLASLSAMSVAGHRRGSGLLLSAAALLDPAREAVEGEVDHRCGEERQHLTYDQSADHRDPERMPQLGAHAPAEHQRQRS